LYATTVACNVFANLFSSSENTMVFTQIAFKWWWRALLLTTSLALQKNTMVFTWIAFQQLWRAMFLTTSVALQKNTMVFTWIAFNNCGVQCCWLRLSKSVL